MIYCLVGESASGKSTIEKRLKDDKGVPNIISYTTRPMRKGEVDGVNYHYITQERFLELQEQGFFVETAMYREWMYGLTLDNIDYKNENYIAVVTVHGLMELIQAVGKEFVKAIYIKVSERDRMFRLLSRGDETDEIIRRIENDRHDFRNADMICNYIVENKSIDTSVYAVYNIIMFNDK